MSRRQGRSKSRTEHLFIILLSRNRIRMYPAFVNCTTIDWFSEWPQDALLEVAEKYLEHIDVGDDELKKNVAEVFVVVHRSVVDMSARMLMEVKRYNYVTPTNYLELVSGYQTLLAEKKKELGDAASKLRNGLEKIDDTRAKVFENHHLDKYARPIW